MSHKLPKVDPGGVVRFVDGGGLMNRAVRVYLDRWVLFWQDNGDVFYEDVSDEELQDRCGPSGFFRELDGLA